MAEAVTEQGAATVVRVRSNDAIWLQDSDDNRMVINALMFLERIDAATLGEAFQQRLLDGAAGRRHRRFRQRVRRESRGWVWEDDPAFAMDRHIREVEPREVETAGGFKSWVETRAIEAMAEDRPLWSMEIVPAALDSSGVDRSGSVVFVRLHHCIGDGIGLIRTMFALMDPIEAGAQQMRSRRGTPSKSFWGRLALFGLPIMAGVTARRADRSRLHGPELTGQKRVGWSDALQLARVKAVKQQAGVTINDVLMTVLAGAFRRYLTDRGEPVPATVRASVPIDMRPSSAEPELENRFITILLDLPCGIEDPAARLKAVQALMDRMKTSVEPATMFFAANAMLRVLPSPLSRFMIDFYAKKCTCVLTNVPGPSEHVTLAGRRVDDFIFWVPQRADIGLGLSILSYAGKVRLGLIGDTALIDEPGPFLGAYFEEFAALERAMGIVAQSPAETRRADVT